MVPQLTAGKYSPCSFHFHHLLQAFLILFRGLHPDPDPYFCSAGTWQTSYMDAATGVLSIWKTGYLNKTCEKNEHFDITYELQQVLQTRICASLGLRMKLKTLWLSGALRYFGQT